MKTKTWITIVLSALSLNAYAGELQSQLGESELVVRLKENPSSEYYRYLYAEALFNSKKYDKALVQVDYVIQMNAHNSKAARLRYDIASAKTRQLAEAPSADVCTYYSKAEINAMVAAEHLSARGKVALALKTYLAQLAKKESMALRRDIVNTLLNVEQYKLASQEAERGLRIHPNDVVLKIFDSKLKAIQQASSLRDKKELKQNAFKDVYVAQETLRNQCQKSRKS